MKYTVEVPFPNDCARFKVIRTNDEGKRVIVTARQTREAAEAEAQRLTEQEGK